MINKNDSKYSELNNIIVEAEKHNSWFSNKNIINVISYWGNQLKENNLREWISEYMIINQSSNVAIIMAGNFPLAGLHDLISVIITGNNAIIKPSSDDKILINYIVNYLNNKFPKTKDIIKICYDKLVDFDKVIATGSNNTFKYFEYYFRGKESLLRKNRTSVAILSGTETIDELRLLSDDIFMYFGLGCRNISKLFIPLGYDLNQLKTKLNKYDYIINHHKYSNNYNYQKTIKLMNGEVFTDCDYFILSESENYAPPISLIYFEYYNDIDEVKKKIRLNNDKIQCIVSRFDIEKSIGFGEAQNPKLNQYADNIDTLKFLLTSS